MSPSRGGDEALASALQPLIGAIDVALMREANRRAIAGGGNASPDAAARWLWGEIERKRGR